MQVALRSGEVQMGVEIGGVLSGEAHTVVDVLSRLTFEVQGEIDAVSTLTCEGQGGIEFVNIAAILRDEALSWNDFQRRTGNLSFGGS
jgi:hypothetical protein